MPPHVRIDFAVPPPGYGRSEVRGAHGTQLRCLNDVSDDKNKCRIPVKGHPTTVQQWPRGGVEV
jgi:hypothetical protein